MFIAHTIENSILFYHPETGKYSVHTFIPHNELLGDVVIQSKGKFYLSKWYEIKTGSFRNVLGEVNQ
jgi:hypothetical protein